MTTISVIQAGLKALFNHESQDNWRWCTKCQGLTFAGNPQPGSCPAGGTHDHKGSGNYKLLKDLARPLGDIGISGQDNWRW